LTNDEIWNLVDYVRSLPYELHTPPKSSATPAHASIEQNRF
jgi:hypothetical protein